MISLRVIYYPLFVMTLACLTDKKGEIRKMSDEVIIIVMGFVGFSKFQEHVQDLKPALQQ